MSLFSVVVLVNRPSIQSSTDIAEARVQPVRLSPNSAVNSPENLGPDRLSNTVWLPAGGTLVIGSLDQNAQHHVVETKWVPAGETHLVAIVAPEEAAQPFDVKRVKPASQHAGWALELEEYSDRSLPPVECDSEVNHRRFAVPYFPGRGGAFERMVIANVIAAGTRTRVYLADDQKSPEDLRPVAHEIVHLLEIGLREFVEEQLTSITDVDMDNHLTIVMCQLADDGAVGPGEEPILGCVREKDFVDPNWELGGDIIYVDLDLPRGQQLAAVLAHELAHAATFSAQRIAQANEPLSQRLPFWLNEGIAHLLEYSVCPQSDNLKARLSGYTAMPNVFPLVLPDRYPNRMVRRGPSRAAALSFLRFLSAKRPDLLPSVLESGSNGIHALEIGTGSSFQDLFRDWSISGLERRKPTVLVSERHSEITIAGTSFATIRAVETSGYLTIEASESAMLQLTIVGQSAVAPRLGRLENSRF